LNVFFFEKFNQVKDEKLYIIKVANKQYKLTKMQIAFLSREALNHFLDPDEPYVFQLPSVSDSINQFSTEDFLSSLNSLISLFSTETELTINEQNRSVFHFISEILDIQVHFKKCCLVTSKKSQTFQFTSKILSSIHKRFHSFFNDFQIKVNGENF
jgi:hypothetical protein